jgi:mono/diheme cytochrome c family protein
MNDRSFWRRVALPLVAIAAAVPAASAATPEELLAAYARQAAAAPSPERGQRFFTERRKDGLYPSCASCHGERPTTPGKDLLSEKPLAALAPAANAARFTDANRVEYRFRLNCIDMLGRECTPGEKADVISWLLTLKP